MVATDGNFSGASGEAMSFPPPTRVSSLPDLKKNLSSFKPKPAPTGGSHGQGVVKDGAYAGMDNEAMAHAAAELQERARERQVTVETALEEVEKRHEAVTAKKSLMEKAIKQVADEAIEALTTTKRQLLTQVSDMSLDKLKQLQHQMEELTRAMDEVRSRRMTLKQAQAAEEERPPAAAPAAVGHGHKEITGLAASTLKEALDKKGVPLTPVVEDDLEYQGPDQAKRKEILDKVLGLASTTSTTTPAAASGLFGKVVKKSKPATTTPAPTKAPTMTKTPSTTPPPPPPAPPSMPSRPPSLKQLSTSSGGSFSGPPYTAQPCSPPPLHLIGAVGVAEDATRKTRLNQPFQVAVDHSFLYIADCGSDRMVVLDKFTLKQVQRMYGSSARLNRPSGVAVDSERLYVVEAGSRSVRAMDKLSAIELWKVTSGERDVEMASPHDVVVDDKHLYIADGYDGMVVVLDKHDGKLVRTFDAPGGFRRILNKISTGLPHGLALDHENPRHLYISCANSRHILVVDKNNGSPIKAFSTSRESATGIQKPYRMVVEKRFLYVADYHNHIVQVLDKYTGLPVATPGEEVKDHQFTFPTGVAMDGKRLFVCEYGAHRVKVFGHEEERPFYC